MKTASGSDFAFPTVKSGNKCASINPHRAGVTGCLLSITEPVSMPFKRYFLEIEKLIPVNYMSAEKSKERH